MLTTISAILIIVSTLIKVILNAYLYAKYKDSNSATVDMVLSYSNYIWYGLFVLGILMLLTSLCVGQNIYSPDLVPSIWERGN